MVKIKKAKLSKRTNRKKNFKKFIDSNYTDHQAFVGACRNDENLLIYTCLTKDELSFYIEEMKKHETVDEQIKYLVNNQPTMNENIDRYNRVVESIAHYLKGYIEYNGFRMANAEGDNEDWTSEFWAKYCKICDFYRTRWFYPEKLKKESSVVFTPMLYKEFIYICRMSITGERKHQAFLATLNENMSIFRLSLDSKLENLDNDKTLADVIPDEDRGADAMLESANLKIIISKALTLCKQYADSAPYYYKIKDFYEKQDPIGFDKKTVILGKIFLYKAGLVSNKILAFIKSLSATYKARYNISTTRITTQIQEAKQKKIVKYNKAKDKEKVLTWKELVFKKRGEL